MHETKPFFTAQFHPEASSGPTDTAHFFDKFLALCQDKTKKLEFFPRNTKPVGERPQVSKVLLLGRLVMHQSAMFSGRGNCARKVPAHVSRNIYFSPLQWRPFYRPGG